MHSVDPELAALLASCVTASDTSITVADATDPDLPLVYVNAAFEAMSGYQAEDVLGRNCRFLQGAGTDPATVRRIAAALQAGHFVDERVLNYRADGTPFWNEVRVSAVRDATGRVLRFMGVQHDVTPQVAAAQEVLDAATQDPLTGLLNRAAFEVHADRELARATRDHRSVAVLFLDVDRFKSVNDTHGHAVGDEYLLNVADALRRRLRAADLASRRGGDEFAVLLADLPHDGAKVAAHVVADLQDALNRPFTVDGAEHVSAVTIGTALFPQDGHTMRELIAHADAHMYRSKPSRPH